MSALEQTSYPEQNFGYVETEGVPTEAVILPFPTQPGIQEVEIELPDPNFIVAQYKSKQIYAYGARTMLSHTPLCALRICGNFMFFSDALRVKRDVKACIEEQLVTAEALFGSPFTSRDEFRRDIAKTRENTRTGYLDANRKVLDYIYVSAKEPWGHSRQTFHPDKNIHVDTGVRNYTFGFLQAILSEVDKSNLIIPKKNTFGCN